MSDATEPAGSYVVSASAGTGKTYLLVTRLLRLLLSGANPASILAITFTRKAASEMQTRLYERLQELALCPDEKLAAALGGLGFEADAALPGRVRTLYQELLLSGWQPRLTTFHSFCQSLLQRFPLEADVPPGFELCESDEDLLEEAFTVLYDEAGSDDSSGLYRNLRRLMDDCGGLHNLKQALKTFVANREDWWAWTGSEADPCAWASAQAATFLGVDATAEPLPAFVQDYTVKLRGMAEGLLLHSRNAYRKHGEALHQLLDTLQADDGDALLAGLYKVFFDSRDAPRNWLAPGKTHKRLTPEQWPQLAELIDSLFTAFEAALEQHRRRRLHALLQHWYVCGDALLARLQRIKTERRQLDFADLEWKACQLLNSSDHAHWVQYKLDQKIDHILVDEFQDTNPTQWRLLYPLLEEFAAADSERARTVFLVGDPKQSIYGFRRAEPRLFAAAGNFLQQHLGAGRSRPVASWRSSPAIIDFLNRICGDPRVASRLPGFEAHATHKQALPGHVEILPLPEASADADTQDADSGQRRPLRSRPPQDDDGPALREGQLIARRIQELMARRLAIQDRDGPRPLRYGDIILLIPTRTHVAGFETALREAGIPYLGADRGTLMDCQEVRDINALLQFLSTPFDNVALATILRSPLYGWSHDQLARLAACHRDDSDWFTRLRRLAAESPEDFLTRPLQQFAAWLDLSGRLPVHDLLDRIYNEAEVRKRYHQALPPSLQGRAMANLNRLIDLSLDMDAGRYPSLHRFLDYLATLGARDKEAPDQGQTQAEERLRIMTIHGAKGLEAPVVFLADSSSGSRNTGAWEALTHWPAEQPRPQLMAIIPKKQLRPQPLLTLLDEQRQRDKEEDMNLLYVALTRPRQYLFISGSSEDGWYGLMRDILDECGQLQTFCPGEGRPFTLPVATDAATAATTPATLPVIHWDRIALSPQRRITPSREDIHGEDPGSEDSTTGAEARLRGTAIHRLLELIADNTLPADQARRQVAAELALGADDERLAHWLSEAEALLAAPALGKLFDPDQYRRARNEVAVLASTTDGETIYGIIDRLVISDDGILIVDYKTHRYQDKDALPALAARYRQQMLYYQRSIAAMYEHLPVTACLLFTAHGDLFDMDILSGSKP